MSLSFLVSACSLVGTDPDLLAESELPCEPLESCNESRQSMPDTTAKDINASDAKKSAIDTDTAKSKGAKSKQKANTAKQPKFTGRLSNTPISVDGTKYLIGPGDQIQIYVWRNPEVSTSVPVRPDGKVTSPLVEDMVAVGKTPTQLARDIEKVLGAYIRDPVVSVIVAGFGGPYSQQIRVVGQAAKPQTLPYKENMSLLDVMIAVGGLTEFAAGNKATIVRVVKDKQKHIKVRLDNLIKKGDISANIAVLPGDILIIPESWF